MSDPKQKETSSLTGDLTFGRAKEGAEIGKRRSREQMDKELYGSGLLGDALAPRRSGELSRRFIVPPFTVLSAREGWWQDRKRAWLDLGIQSELGRGEDGANSAELAHTLAKPHSDVTAPIPTIPKAAATSGPKKPVKTRTPAAQQAAQPRARFTAPTIIVADDDDDEVDRGKETPKKPLPMTKLMQEALALPDDEPPRFDRDTWVNDRAPVGMDVESYINYFFIGFKNFHNGKRLGFELSSRSPELDIDFIKWVLQPNCIITFNGFGYDLPMLTMALKGESTHELKKATNRLIFGDIPPWKIEEEFGIQFYPCDHVDIQETCPSYQSLKMIGGRMHAPLIMDLPYDPEATLSWQQMNVASLYCHNDLDTTQIAFNAVAEPLRLRVALGKRYGLDLRSKSDAQVGEAIVKKRIEMRTKRRISGKTPDVDPTFKYQVPPFIKFQTPQLQTVVDKLRVSDFHVHAYGVNGPEWLKETTITIGSSTYQMGIGGLHSTEETRALVSTDTHQLVDADVAGQYPEIIVRLGELGHYPKGAGKVFIPEYKDMKTERNDAKKGAAEAKKAGDKEREAPLKAAADGGKIANNGVYGKTGARSGFLKSPSMMIHTTLTGQLTVLMIIEAAELRGISVVSGNTDGVLFYCPREKLDELYVMLKRWEQETGFEVETVKYKAIYNRDVNTYMAIKEDGTAKRKGPIGNPWAEKDLRGMLSKNPQMTVCGDAVLEYIKHGTPFEETIRSRTDPREFVTVIQAKTGAEWRGTYLGKVVRYYWSTDHDPIYATGGKRRKVAKTDGARPMMELTDTLPDDIDYARYVEEAQTWALELGVITKSTIFKKGQVQ